MDTQCKSNYEARRLLDWNNATGTYLGRLAKKVPHPRESGTLEFVEAMEDHSVKLLFS